MGRLYCLLVLLDFKKIINHYGLTASISLETTFKCAHSLTNSPSDKRENLMAYCSQYDPYGLVRIQPANLQRIIPHPPSPSYSNPTKTAIFNYEVDQQKRYFIDMSEVERYALLGDVGGTNIRLQLVSVDTTKNTPLATLKKETLAVADYDVFQSAIEKFLAGVEHYPEVASIGIAGPIFDNTVSLANVEKWKTLSGEQLGTNLKIPHFRFINDFQAASYGILLVPEENFVPINDVQPNPNKMRGVIGPGTGLGNSMLYPATIKNHKETIVLPCEGGHTDFPNIDAEAQEFVQFLSKQFNNEYISVERSFCGPTIPKMFKFYAQKYPEDEEAKLEKVTPEEVVSKGVQPDAPRIFASAVNLLIKIYSSVIGNFIVHHMTVGGVYLVGSLTNSLIPKIKGVDILAEYKTRHSNISGLVGKAAIIVCTDIDLGLKGAYFVARSLLLNQ